MEKKLHFPLIGSYCAHNSIYFKHHVWHTRAKSFEAGAVVLVHPMVSVLEQQADRRGSPIKLVYLKSLDRLPVPSCEQQNTPKLALHVTILKS